MRNWSTGLMNYLIAAGSCAIVTAGAAIIWPHLDPINTVMLFLLAVFLIGLKLGRGPAVMAAFLSVLLFDVFFIPPYLSLAVSDAQYLLTFAVMLAVGLATTQLTAGLARETERVMEREHRTRQLYALSHDFAGAASETHVRTALAAVLADTPYEAELNLQDLADASAPGMPKDILSAVLDSVAREGELPFETAHISGDGRLTYYLPLKAPTGICGVLAVTPRPGTVASAKCDLPLLEAIASLLALVVERLHFVDVAQATQIQVETERLRASILSALSHDLRTPMTALVGLADQIALQEAGAHPQLAEIVGMIRDQARAMSQLLAKLLDMARLQAGHLQLKKEWQLFEDVVAASLKFLKPALAGHPISVTLDPALPLVAFDGVLLERAVSNLIENAAKYAPAGTPIAIRGYVQGSEACLSIEDHGPGFPIEDPTQLFKAFVRGAAESPIPGVGLGLAIAQAIVAAHGGRILARSRSGGGAEAVICLPLGTPPAIESEAS